MMDMNNEPLSKTPSTLGAFLLKQKKQIEAALPKHLTSERMLRIVMTELRKIPKLKECTPESLIGAIIQCCQLGLEPGSALGHAYLLPYENRKKGITECQFIVGYRGMMDLARRSGQVLSLCARTVYAEDTFEFEYGLEEKLRHIPTKSERGPLMGVYALAHLKGGGKQIEVLFKNEIEAIRRRSKAADSGPWVTDYEEMAKKTVIRKLFKYLPVSIELQRAVISDEAADHGLQDNPITIEGEMEEEPSTHPIPPDPYSPSSKADRLAKKIEANINNQEGVHP